MPIQIIGDQSSSEIMIQREFLENSSGTISLNGSGIKVAIRTIRCSHAVDMKLGDNSLFEMQENAFISNLNVYLVNGARAKIGTSTFGIGSVRLFSHENAEIFIGNDCLLGGDLLCMTSDMHSILDVDTGLRINPPGNIHISDKVWIGAEVTILKGTILGSGSIVGIRSTVMGEFPGNCLILGYPARLIRRGVTWSEDLKPLPNLGLFRGICLDFVLSGPPRKSSIDAYER